MRVNTVGFVYDFDAYYHIGYMYICISVGLLDFIDSIQF